MARKGLQLVSRLTVLWAKGVMWLQMRALRRGSGSPGRGPQHRAHGLHHQPAKGAVRPRTAHLEDVGPKKEAQDQEAERDGRGEQQREEPLRGALGGLH